MYASIIAVPFMIDLRTGTIRPWSPSTAFDHTAAGWVAGWVALAGAAAGAVDAAGCDEPCPAAGEAVERSKYRLLK